MVSRRRARACWRALLVGALALAVPAPSVAAPTMPGGGCSGYAYEQPFKRWLDPAHYVLMPNGGVEAGTSGWKLAGGAKAAAGNESYYVRDPGDASSLSLPPGSSATTGRLCVSATSPTVRFFVRNSGSLLSTLKVEVLYTDALGQARALAVAELGGGPSWQPTLPIAFLANLTPLPLVTDGTTTVAFRFTPQGSLGGWTIDDVYVDPFKGE